MENVGGTLENARQKTVEWLESEKGWEGVWKNVKEQVRRKKATLDDYATPIYKETGKMFRDACSAIQDKINKIK